MKNLRNVRPSFAFVTFVCAAAISGTVSQAAGQVGTGETVIQKATEQFESSPLKTTPLDKGVWMFSGDGGNATAIVAASSTLLIDSGIDSRVSELGDAIYKATGRPVTRLVNTHWHFDHTGGNIYFGSGGVTILAQENVKKRLSSVQNVPFTGLRDGRYPTQALPTVNYSDSTTLQQDAQKLTLVNYGPAHTDGDTIIYIAPANIAVVGDIFSNHFYPIIDLASGGSIDGMIHSVDQILAQTNEQTKIVPGHGPVATRSDLQDYRDMLVQVRQRIKGLAAAGKTIDEAAAAAPIKDFDAKWGSGYVSPDVFVRMVFTSLIDSSNTNR
ncbi:MAG TPA: MBL fold metallo-hydrolase [Candidatus Acidoferrales bacterium]|jgi:cyclase|nr:MBL fold metallo-hydrolase [Candidatus Acidoferrales bacterium]